MADGTIENIFLVNAPAGSGKTTTIRAMMLKHILQQPDDNILCITYTNRAADELKKGLDTNKIFIGTIHSFFNSFIGIYLSHKQIIDLYFDLYSVAIQERIANSSEDANINSSNEKYIEKYGALNFDIVRANIKSIYYNESPYNYLYYGGLSHDDLISFTKELFDRFPVIQKRLTQKFQMIFVDEYQDSSASVLKLFYDAVKGTTSRLYFLGDKMQQIYKNYDGSFEAELPTLNHSIALATNHRSIPVIIDILNKIYNDPSFTQNTSEKNVSITPVHSPRVLICDDILESVRAEKSKYTEALLLFLPNNKKFESIGAGNLFRQVSNMEKYKYGRQYSAVNVLTDNTDENPDPLFKLLFIITQVVVFDMQKKMGCTIQLFKASPKIFNKEVFTVKTHEDKGRLNSKLNSIVNAYLSDEQTPDIGGVLSVIKDSGLVKQEYIASIIDSGEYSSVLIVAVKEFRAISEYLKAPDVSTQHGVKGESHDTVFFIAEDSTNLEVHMYRFFELWSHINISLSTFESFYYRYAKFVEEVTTTIGVKPSKINKGILAQHSGFLEEKSAELMSQFAGNEIFEYLCKKPYVEYLKKPNVSNAKECFKESIPFGALSAYRLFYVGCSRARKNLSIFVEKDKIAPFCTKFTEKLTSVGFAAETMPSKE